MRITNKVLHSNKIGFKNLPQKKNMIGQMSQSPYVAGQNIGIQKKNIAHTDSGDIISSSTGYDKQVQRRYINQAIKQADAAEKYGLRPVISNRAYGGEVISRNQSLNQHINNSSQSNNQNLKINKSYDSVKRTGATIINTNSLTPFQNRNQSFQQIPQTRSIIDRMQGISSQKNNGVSNIAFPQINQRANQY